MLKRRRKEGIVISNICGMIGYEIKPVPPGRVKATCIKHNRIEFCYSTTNEFVEASILKKIWENFKNALRTDHEIC